MAKAPKDPNAPKKTRSVKPQRFFLLYKGNIDDMQLVRSAEDALDMQDSDKGWNMKRLTLPKGKTPAAKNADPTTV